MVIDADGLKLLSKIKDWWTFLPTDSILTPHPGEMAILTGESIDEIQSNRIDVASKYAKNWNVVVVLKGAFTVIASPDGRCALIPVATSALAHAGTGDVLAGMIASLIGQGMKPFEAASAGAWLHAQIALLAAEQSHPAAVLASDLPDLIGLIMSELTE
jgi:NAD(P)H-hydrate epimerase